MMATKESTLPAVEHEEYGKLTICRNYNDVKPLIKEKIKVVSQDNSKQIVWIQLERDNKIIPLSFSAMIFLLRN